MVERIREILETRHLTPTQFADAIGIARPIISHILSGRNKPSLEVVQKITAAFPDLPLAWLLHGIGAMEVPAATGPRPEPAPVPAPTASATKTAENRAGKPVGARVPPQGVLPVPRPFVATGRPTATKVPAASDAPAHNPPLVAVESPVLPPAEPPAESSAVPAAATDTSSAPAPGIPVAPAVSFATAFAEPGKSIRRIVIFYQDGTFTDYRPEA